MSIITSNSVDVAYGKESTFGTAPATIASLFGLETKLSPSAKRNVKPFHDLGKRTFVTAKDMKFEGSVDVDFTMTGIAFLEYVLCSGNGTGVTPYIFDPDGTAKSMSVLINDRAENLQRTILGLAFADLTMTGSVGEDIRVKMSGQYKDISASASAVTRASLGLTQGTPFTFEHGEVQISSTDNYYGLLQKFDLKISDDLEMYYSFGNVRPNTPKHKKAVGGITMGVKKTSDATEQGIDIVRPDSTDGDDITITITLNDSIHSYQFTITGSYLDTFSTGLEAANDIDENLVFIFSDISVEEL